MQERKNQQGREPEGRGADADDRKDADDLVGPAVAVERGENAEREGDENGDEQTEEGQLQGQGQGLGHQVRHAGRAGAVGAEVTVDHVPQVAAVLDEERVVETVLCPIRLEGLGGCRLTERRVGGIHGRQPHD